MPRSSRLAVAAALLLAAAPLGAQTVFSGTGAGATTAAAAFLAAHPVRTIQSFDALTNGQLVVSFSYVGGGTATLANGFGVTDAYPYNGTAVSPTRGYGAYPDSAIGDDPTVDFTTPVGAFGAYFVDTEVAAAPDFLTFTLVGGGTLSFTIPISGDGGVSFLGIDFGSQRVSALLIDLAHDDAVLIDDLTIAASAVPEPSTWVLLGAGLVALGVAARRRRTA